MMRHMSLCSGYGGIDLALKQVLGAETVAVADIDPGACKILEHRFPGVPNLGDISVVDWAQWTGKVEIVSAGFPCQDVSSAGKRAGLMRGKNRSGMWAHVCDAVETIQPRLVLLENVRGLLSAKADSDMEPCSWCVGDDDSQPSMRALGAVLGDLADIGFDASWYGLRASDIGAAHHRWRVFVFAWPIEFTEGRRIAQWLADSRIADDGLAHDGPSGRADGSVGLSLPTPVANPSWSSAPPDTKRGKHAINLEDVIEHSLPTPAASQGDSLRTSDGRPDLGRTIQALPTPVVNDMGADKTTQWWDEWTDKIGGHGASLSVEMQRLAESTDPIPTPTASLRDVSPEQFEARYGDHGSRGKNGMNLTDAIHVLPTVRTENNENLQSDDWGGADGNFHGLVRGLTDWGQYAAAIHRQEVAFGMPAPEPTVKAGDKGYRRLSPKFTEWLMGLPPGWITDVPGVTRAEAIKACGNGVVPQQCAGALNLCINHLQDPEGPLSW